MFCIFLYCCYESVVNINTCIIWKCTSIGSKNEILRNHGSKNAINILPPLCAPLGLLGCSAFGHDQIAMTNHLFVLHLFIICNNNNKFFFENDGTHDGACLSV